MSFVATGGDELEVLHVIVGMQLRQRGNRELRLLLCLAGANNVGPTNRASGVEDIKLVPNPCLADRIPTDPDQTERMRV